MIMLFPFSCIYMLTVGLYYVVTVKNLPTPRIPKQEEDPTLRLLLNTLASPLTLLLKFYEALQSLL